MMGLAPLKSAWPALAICIALLSGCAQPQRQLSSDSAIESTENVESQEFRLIRRGAAGKRKVLIKEFEPVCHR